ncbi:hypothetical protein FHR32_002174 [Streptosporangium album]|uniref:Uncharacterized protein n=1 Tax=Streptosporangium album TaxID=47479 RepID=A0A7W7RTE6_9ACTN|nr:hypothetical protein [Streptosporangium album]MBB4937869.1 hypothetical protein [Streptosporangium album]
MRLTRSQILAGPAFLVVMVTGATAPHARTHPPTQAVRRAGDV